VGLGGGRPAGPGGRLPLRVDLAPAQGPAAHGIGADGALLVRPDGFVAWRSIHAAAESTRILRTILSAPA
jgi:putative polyketide hydroxylase